MKVLINRRPVEGPYGGGNLFVQAAYKYLPEFGYTPVGSLTDNPDVILMIDPRPDGACPGVDELKRYAKRAPGLVQIIHRINECDARKATDGVDQMLLTAQGLRVHKVFVSHWLHRHLESRWEQIDPDCIKKGLIQPGDYNIIYNGVDGELFKPRTKLNNGRINIVAHHWSDNKLKGADVYEQIDQLVGDHPDRFTFTYIGRHQCVFKHTRVVAPLFGEALGAELGQHDVYVSASRFDPGPNHITESISCELPTYVHHDGGGSVEFAGVDHVYQSWNELRTILLSGEFQRNTTCFTDWRECIRQYTKLFDELTGYMP